MTILHNVKFVFSQAQRQYEVFPIPMRNYPYVVRFAKMYTQLRFLLERKFKEGWGLGDEINSVFTEEELSRGRHDD